MDNSYPDPGDPAVVEVIVSYQKSLTKEEWEARIARSLPPDRRSVGIPLDLSDPETRAMFERAEAELRAEQKG